MKCLIRSLKDLVTPSGYCSDMSDPVVAAWETLRACDPDPVALAQATETVIAFAHSRQLEAFSKAADEALLGADPDGVVVDPTAAEMGCALFWTPGAASARTDLACDVVENLPAVLHAMRSGRIDLVKAREISNATCELMPRARAQLAEQAVSYATNHTRGQLAAWLVRQVLRHDPEAARRRRKAARRHRGVCVRPEADGMATVSALLTAEEAAACMESLRAASNAIDGSRQANQADVFVERLTGINPGQPVPVTVLVTEDGPDLPGIGPISEEHLADLFTIIRDVRDPGPSRGYRPGPQLEQYVRAHHRHCRFPGCRRPARNADLDHIVRWPQGRSTARNLHPLCRYHHRLKTHTSWRVICIGDTEYWTSPRGHRYVSYRNDP